jgi:hypothetical protein
VHCIYIFYPKAFTSGSAYSRHITNMTAFSSNLHSALSVPVNFSRRSSVSLLILTLVQTLANEEFIFGDSHYLKETTANSTDDNISKTMAPTISSSSNGHSHGHLSPTVAPTMTHGSKGSSTSSSSSGSASGFFYLCLLVLAIVGSWFIYGYCSKKRELRMLDERSRAADRVLGDMQMIPQDDYDNEII